MLYDILPPLLLLFSFGGIIVLIARGIVKMRAHEVSQEIQAHIVSDTPVHAESVIGPNKGNVRMVKNRLLHAGTILGQSITGTVSAAKSGIASYKASVKMKKEQKAEQVRTQPAKPQDKPAIKTGIKSVVKGIQLPEVSIREKFEAFTEKGKQGFSSLHQAIVSRAPSMKEGIQTMRDQIVAK
ncbi:MAG TPA: hypothetical protein VLG69_03090, partial [Candidatus Andersenbacteria bacterium]|nr:hypothetical protein [Candidatus Andersenbacteria bacterium]